jgi:hypothetical protein
MTTVSWSICITHNFFNKELLDYSSFNKRSLQYYFKIYLKLAGARGPKGGSERPENL